MTATKDVHVEYYAVFREQRGLGSEKRSTQAATLRDLYMELKHEYGFTLPLDSVRVAVADEFSQWDCEIRQGDKVVFIPPVAGG